MAGKRDTAKWTPLKAVRQTERTGRVPSDQRLEKQTGEKRTSAIPRKGEERRERGSSNAAVRKGQKATTNQHTTKKKGK